jgi:Tfp pilus assembly protein PilX
MPSVKRHHERGAALILVLLALLLISAIGLGMLFSADTETAIAANYRDKQVALYAAQSGLQEARDRIQPSTGDIASAGVPALLASNGAANVVYILNPGAGETNSDIKPWDPSNKYYDSDFCNKVPSLCTTGTPKKPLSTSGYTAFDNSSGAYKFSIPLNFKWARILLKSDRMTSVPVETCDASQSTIHCTLNATETQVCWNGKNQVLRESNYGTDCLPQGALLSVNLTNTGSGYSSTPTVTISPPLTGVTATATANVTYTSTGQVASANVTSGGIGYTTAPTVMFVAKPGDPGTGATGYAVIGQGGAPVDHVSSFNAGTGCYASATPAVVTLSGGGGSGAKAVSTMTSPTCVVSWSASGSCPHSYAGQTITVNGSGGSGSGFSGKMTFKTGNASVSGVTVTTAGSGYGTPPTGVSAPTGCSLTTKFVLGYQMSGISVSNGGTGYTAAPNITVTPPQIGSTPTATAVLGAPASNVGQVTSIVITNPGSGYLQKPDVVFTSVIGAGGLPIGFGAAAQAQMNSTGSVTSITLTNAGSGYTVPPTVTISGPGGSGTVASATAIVDHSPYLGQVFLLTALASSVGGSKAMEEMEAATAVRTFKPSVTGALTLAGPNPTFDAAHSNNLTVHGNDANSCGGVSTGKLPAIGVYQDPNSTVNVVDQVKAELPKAVNYTGMDVSGDVHDVTSSLGDMAGGPSNFEAIVQAAKLIQTQPMYGTNPSNISMGCNVVANANCTFTTSAGTQATGPAVDVVNGDLSLGPGSGYGILVVTGNLTMSGNFSWNGLILVLGSGGITFNGGGNGTITGSIIAAKITDNSQNPPPLLDQLGSPDISWTGGGTNAIQYDHCWADNMMAMLPYNPPPTKSPLQILSVRSIGN